MSCNCDMRRATGFFFLFWKIRCKDFGQNGQKNELLNPAVRACYGSVILLIALREEMSGLELFVFPLLCMITKVLPSGSL